MKAQLWIPSQVVLPGFRQISMKMELSWIFVAVTLHRFTAAPRSVDSKLRIYSQQAVIAARGRVTLLYQLELLGVTGHQAETGKPLVLTGL